MALSYFADLVLRLELSGESIQATLGGPDGWLVEAASSHDLLQFLRSHAADSFSGETSLTVSEAQDLGRLISRAALPEPIASELRGQMRKGSVRLGLAVSPELAAIPWEYAYLDEEDIGFLAQHPAVRIHRVSGARPFTSEPSDVRSVFVALADPQSRTYPRLGSCEAEFKSVLAALKAPECKHLKVESLEHATPKMLDAALEKDRFGVFHFIGHGDVKPTGGVLVLEGGLAKQESLVYADVLAKTLISSGTQLVVLSSCTSAGAATSLGVQLSLLGIPAVVGMQTAVSDVDVHLFARTLYSALVAGHTIEEAVYEGRMAIRGSGLGWGAPVLVTSNPEMRVFQVAAVASTPLRGNLPKPLTSFIGRAAQIAEVVKLLETGRLVILHGSGGIGKTRLSIEIGRTAGVRFPQGVWQVLLDTISDPDQVLSAIASVFGIRDSSEKPVEERLFDFLSDQELLIILDNCEHLVPACRAAAVRILQTCPGVSILATSRDVLGTGAETVVKIPSLSYPEIDEDGNIESKKNLPPLGEVPEGGWGRTRKTPNIESSPLGEVPEGGWGRTRKTPTPESAPQTLSVEDTVRNYEAIQLLVARAKSAKSSFEPTPGNIEALCRIAKRLDGIPLALELAASRVRSFTPQQILEKLTKDLAWLDLENPGTVPRHKTLRAALDWSYGLLSGKEKALFNRLGVFNGTFSLEAAEAVAGFEPLEAGEVGDLLAGLVDKSLVVTEEREYEMRYRMLDSCRAYAAERLAFSGESEDVRNRHVESTSSTVTQLFAHLRVGDHGRWQAQMADEQVNIRAAIEWGLGDGDKPETAAQIALDSVIFWLRIGYDLAGIRIMERALESLPGADADLRARLMIEIGSIRATHGDIAGYGYMKEAFVALKTESPEYRRYASHKLGNAAYDVGDDGTAVEMFSWILDHCREIGDHVLEGSAQLRLANIQVSRGRFSEARKNLAETAHKKSKEGHILGEGVAYCALAHVEWLMDDEEYRNHYRRGISRLIPLEDFAGLPDYLCLASSVHLPETPSVAAKLQGFADRIKEEAGYSPERFVTGWSEHIKDLTRALLPQYECLHKAGWTMSREEVAECFVMSDLTFAVPQASQI